MLNLSENSINEKIYAFVNVIAILFFPIALSGNNIKIDSLQKQYDLCNTASCKLNIKIELAKQFSIEDPTQAINIIDEINNSFSNFTTPEVVALLAQLKGNSYRRLSNTDSSEKYLKTAIALYSKLNQHDQVILLHNDIGSLYSSIGAYNVSLKYFIDGIKMSEDKKIPQYLSLLYNSIGNTYGLLKQYDVSNEFYTKALQDNSNKSLEANTYSNIAINFSETGRYDSAIYYYRISNNIRKEINDIIGINNNYINYANAFSLSGQYDSAHFYIDNAIQYYTDNNEEWALGYCYDIKGNTYRFQKEYNLSKQYLDKAIIILKKYQDTWALKETYLNAYNLEKELANFPKALDYFLLYSTLNDSISNADLKAQIYLQEKIYETQKKESQILLLNKENEIKSGKLKRNTISLIFLAVLIFLLFIILYIFNRNNQFKTKTNLLLEDKNKELKKLNATKDKLFSIIAHDLKNPVSAFRNITGSIHKHFDNLSKDDLQDFIAQLNESSAKLMDLLHNLLNWSISQTNNIKVKLKQQLLYPIILKSINAVQINADEKNISIVNNVSEDISANFDENIVETILRNLISNAIKFTPTNGIISIYSEQMPSNKIKICVQDTGIGINFEDQQKLFSINEDVSKIGNAAEKGTGLGLILCKELIEKMDGNIGVSSKENEGSIFYIVFNL